jgi:SAM-dependent methyltransferase
MHDDILQEQLQYYRDRASEYDQWFLREGRYDRGTEHRQQWFAEIVEVKSALTGAAPSGDILELACGTGLWTQHLAPLATRLVAVDASPEVIAINQQRVGNTLAGKPVEYRIADLFNWSPPQQFDFVFFGFWLSHVPAEKFAPFWSMVQSALKPSGQVFFVDSLLNQASTAQDHAALHHAGYSERKLNNGRTYRVIKIFYDPDSLNQRLQSIGWTGQLESTANFFLCGLVHPQDQSAL